MGFLEDVEDESLDAFGSVDAEAAFRNFASKRTFLSAAV